MKITLPIYWVQEFKTKKDKKHLVGLNFYRNAHYQILNKVKKYYHDLIKDKNIPEYYETYIINFKVYLKNTASD